METLMNSTKQDLEELALLENLWMKKLLKQSME